MGIAVGVDARVAVGTGVWVDAGVPRGIGRVRRWQQVLQRRLGPLASTGGSRCLPNPTQHCAADPICP